MDIVESQARFFKALTHPVRLAILQILRHGEQCVCHIEAQLNCRQAYISQQLAVLREAGLLQVRREGWNVYYQVVQPEVYALIDLASQMVVEDGSSGSETKSIWKKTGQCPCPKCSGSVEMKSETWMEEK
jgi:DNA-binding transcriptional ArsR family regulator